MSSQAGAASPRAINIWLLSLASALSPFGMVVVVPTLGALAREFDISFGEAQFLISAYLFGLGAAQPFSGLLCDRLGRRPVLLGGFVVFVLASIGCALAESMTALVVLRFLQAVGVSVGTVASRAIVRDTHDEAGTARALATIAAAMGIAPVIAPVIGGLVAEIAGPQAVFLVSAGLGTLAWLSILGRLEETRPPGVLEASRNARLTADYRQLLGSRVFMGYTLMFGFVQGGFFCFLAVGAAVFEADLGMGPREFGLVWGVMAIAYVAGAALANPADRQARHAPGHLYRLGADAGIRLGHLSRDRGLRCAVLHARTDAGTADERQRTGHTRIDGRRGKLPARDRRHQFGAVQRAGPGAERCVQYRRRFALYRRLRAGRTADGRRRNTHGDHRLDDSRAARGLTRLRNRAPDRARS